MKTTDYNKYKCPICHEYNPVYHWRYKGDQTYIVAVCAEHETYLKFVPVKPPYTELAKGEWIPKKDKRKMELGFNLFD